MIDISIICPVYKAESYIKRCIDSILASNFKNWELILVDDGSPDSSGAICENYAALDERISVIHKKNGGVSAARQTGLDAAKGEYVVHVDPDDWMEPAMLLDLHNEAMRSNADLTYCDFYWDYGSRAVRQSQYFADISSDNLMQHLLDGTYHGNCWNKLVKRDFIVRNKIRFPEGFMLYEDMYFVAALLLCQPRIAYVNIVGYHYSIDYNTNSISKNIGCYDYDVMVLDRFTNLFRGTSLYKKVEHRFATLTFVREFDRGTSTNFLFCKRFFKYRDVCKSLEFRTWPLYYLSCIGFYKPMKFLVDFLKRQKK